MRIGKTARAIVVTGLMVLAAYGEPEEKPVQSGLAGPAAMDNKVVNDENH